ncbi:MAG: transglutaminase family protein [Mogibacterium sp.]|nr:transglutaminase family protein [Mogibacterium sp.]
MLLDFSYETLLRFSGPVADQHFSLLCLPRETERQSVLSTEIRVQPEAPVQTDIDGFGNPMLYGLIRTPHDRFRLTVTGQVLTRPAPHEEFEDPEDPVLTRWRVPSGFTAPGPALRALRQQWADGAPEDPYGKLLHYGNCVQAALRYEPGTTGVRTTAEEAVRLGTGVCQDYAHVLIALLRMEGIPARYVTGLMTGEGASHAWVEANCRGFWYGIDATNDLLVDEHYIKFAHGRDYADCMISRGIFRNPNALQQMDVTVSVTGQNG